MNLTRPFYFIILLALSSTTYAVERLDNAQKEKLLNFLSIADTDTRTQLIRRNMSASLVFLTQKIEDSYFSIVNQAIIDKHKLMLSTSENIVIGLAISEHSLNKTIELLHEGEPRLGKNDLVFSSIASSYLSLRHLNMEVTQFFHENWEYIEKIGMKDVYYEIKDQNRDEAEFSQIVNLGYIKHIKKE